MEETITTEQFTPENNGHGIGLTSEAQFYLNDGAWWARFLGILGFIFTGFIAIIALFAGSVFETVMRMNPAMPPNSSVAGLGGFVTVSYLVMALVYFFPSLYVFRFGSKAKKALLFASAEEMTGAISNLKSFFKFWGIIAIIMLVIMILAIAGLMLGIMAAQGLKH